MSDTSNATTARTLSRDALIIDRAEYRQQRSAARERMIPLRALRRIRLGEQLVLEFENAETLQYQVQEMVYAEGLTDEAAIVDELSAYSRMLPTSHELCATFFVELEDLATVRAELKRLTGVQKSVSIRVGDDLVSARELPGRDETGPSDETYSVHFLRFSFSDEQRDSFRDPRVPASIVVDHPRYREEAQIADDTRKSLIADLALGA